MLTEKFVKRLSIRDSNSVYSGYHVAYLQIGIEGRAAINYQSDRCALVGLKFLAFSVVEVTADRCESR